jgi:hydrogenase expression/formation protein HypC
MCLAIPGKIVELTPHEEHVALVEVVGVRRRVDIRLVEDAGAKPGDWVLIHVGFALSRISEEDALDQMRMLTMLGESDAAMEEVSGYDSGDEGTPPAEWPSP